MNSVVIKTCLLSFSVSVVFYRFFFCLYDKIISQLYSLYVKLNTKMHLLRHLLKKTLLRQKSFIEHIHTMHSKMILGQLRNC